MRCFVSTCELDDPHAAAMIEQLAADGWEVDQSPRGPSSDPCWPDWYRGGCVAAMSRADAVVSVVTAGWDGSSWMAHEAWTAQQLVRPLFVWNPAGRCIPVGMQCYAGQTLASDVKTAVATLLRAVRASGA